MTYLNLNSLFSSIISPGMQKPPESVVFMTMKHSPFRLFFNLFSENI